MNRNIWDPKDFCRQFTQDGENDEKNKQALEQVKGLLKDTATREQLKNILINNDVNEPDGKLDWIASTPAQ